MLRIYNRFKHAFERFLQRGVKYRLFLVAALIGLISLVGGALIVAGTKGSVNLGDSIWWAFLRLTDPGYLGDDEGAFKRVVSTIVTVLGYVLFMGSLVAILTQWLNATIMKLESGLTPVVRSNHLLVLGWTERASIVVRDLFSSEHSVRRFLKRRGARKLHIVVLAEDVGAAMRDDFKTRVGPAWNYRQVTLRSGSALRSEHLSRVDFLRASTVILPAGDFAKCGPEAVDTYTIKALLSMSNHPDVGNAQHLPLAVAEVLDVRKVEIAEAAYSGPLEVLASDVVVSRLLAQNIRHRGLSHAYTELLTHREGNELFVRDLPVLHGAMFGQLVALFSDAIPIGLVRPEESGLIAHLNPSREMVYQEGDRLVLVAREYEATDPTSTLASAQEGTSNAMQRSRVSKRTGKDRLLVLGWSHKVPPLLWELSNGDGATLHVDVVSAVPVGDRDAAMSSYVSNLRNVDVHHKKLDYTMPSDMSQLAVGSYDVILFLGNDWLSTGEESDARTIVGYLTLQLQLATTEKRPHIIVELLDPSNVDLLGRHPGEVLVSPVILSHMLAQISLRRELNVVFDDLFSFGGCMITFKPAAEYGYAGAKRTFAEFQLAATQRGEVALGIVSRDAAGEPSLHLNPSQSLAFTLSADDELVVLSNRPDVQSAVPE